MGSSSASPARGSSCAAAPGAFKERMMERDVSALTAKYTYGTWRYQKGWKPLHVTKAEGCYFWDKGGKRYLDLSAQLMCSNLGHQNPAVVEAICKQARDMAFIS